MPDLPFQTITQFVALGLTLIAGWFLGLASSSGGRKWRERYYDEELNSAGYRDRAETDLRDAARRIRELEDENARLRAASVAAPEVAAPVIAPAPVVAPAPILAPAPPPAPAEPEGHSTATVVGAALAGAVAGAAVTHAVEQREPSPASEARPAYAEPVQVAAAPEPLPAPPAPVEAAHIEPAPAAPPPEPVIALPGDTAPAPADPPANGQH